VVSVRVAWSSLSLSPRRFAVWIGESSPSVTALDGRADDRGEVRARMVPCEGVGHDDFFGVLSRPSVRGHALRRGTS